MSKKHVPANVFLKCDKGVTPCRLQIMRPGPNLYDEKWAVESDALPLVNVTSFGLCAITHAPCVPATVRWQNPLLGSTKIVAMGMPQNPLMDDSFLPCTLGGKIDIFFTRAAVTQALADDQQEAAAKKVAEEAKAQAGLLFFAAIAVAVVVVVATGGAALPLVLGAAATGAVIGGGVGAVAGGMEGYAHGGTMGAVKGAAGGLLIGAAMGAVGGAAAVAGGPASLALMEASGAMFGIATAADAFAFYKKPTLANGLVLASDLVVLFGAKVIEAKANEIGGRVEEVAGAQKLETTPGAEKTKCTGRNDPVDVASGAMFFDSVDFTLPGPVPVIWERTWYSTSERKGPLGYGWHHRYDLALWPEASTGTVAMRLGDGRLAVFDAPAPENDHCSYHRGRKLELRPAPGGLDGYEVYSTIEQLTYRFVPSVAQPEQYSLTAIADGYGHAVRFDYDERGHLQRLVDSVGRPVGITTDAQGRMLTVSLPHPDGSAGSFVAVRYAYDEAGHMTQMSDAEGHTRQFHFEGNRLVRKTFAEGTSYYYEYDALGRCTRTWGDENYYNGRFVYEPGCTTLYTDDPAAVDVYYHEQGLVTTHIDPLGAQHHWRYNVYAELEAVQDPLGHTTTYTYDARGNCTAVAYPDGGQERTAFDDRDRPVQGTDAGGSAWQWAYNEAGQLAEKTDPTGATTRYRYDAQGRTVELADALGHATRLRYDGQHNLAHVVAPDESIRSRAYDALGRLVASTDALGHTQHRRYDRLGQVVALREPDGRETHLAYDAEGNVLLMRTDNLEAAFKYTAVNRLAVRHQAGQELHFAYDRQARLIGCTNEYGQRYSFGLNAAGRVVTEEGFDGLLRRYKRDATGRVVTAHRANGCITTYSYDAAGRIIEVRFDDDTSEHFTYEANGELLEARNDSTTIRFERDTLGRVVKEQQGEHTVVSNYDLRGQRTALSSSLGACFAWQHDSLGRLATVEANEKWQANLFHDACGKELQRTLSGGVRVGWQHDQLGRPTQQHVVGKGSTRQRRYQWEGLDQLAAIDDSNDLGTSRYAYDACGALIGSHYANGDQDVRLTDAVGNLFRSSTCKDRRYAAGGQLREAEGTRYHYDDEGNLVRKVTQSGDIWHYTWGPKGQLVAVILPSGYAVTFTYDALGRRVSKNYRGVTTRWVWDGSKPLHEWQQLETCNKNPAVQELATWLFEENSHALTAKLRANDNQSVVCDHLGTPMAMYDQHGNATWEAQFDAYGAIRQGKGQPQDCPFRYQGQYEDTETGLYYNRFRYYDPKAGTYISQDPLRLWGGGRLYAYVKNTQNWLDVLGLIPVYRNLRPNENPAEGLSAKNPGRGMSPAGHVRNGSNANFKGSQYISTTTDPEVAAKWRAEGQTTVTFDTNNVVPDSHGNRSIVDLTTPEKAAEAGVKGPARNYAINSQEVLVEGHVPADKITKISPC
ncbi:hypothetical protein GCM10022409_09160 [Hymenobacter glaciei]|uniref:DUF4280 domain-containing protein n=1 Tax=Hymenobacter glaciei TaxID=877209 RepID=A0ABP7TLH2_9BACT